jgi:adenylosuccinate synthase
MSGLCVTKLDVLADLPDAAVCVGYEDGLDPGRDNLDGARPVVQPIPGWDEADLGPRLREARTLEQIPAPVRGYLDFIAEHVGVEVVLVSVGPQRDQTISLSEPF